MFVQPLSLSYLGSLVVFLMSRDSEAGEHIKETFHLVEPTSRHSLDKLSVQVFMIKAGIRGCITPFIWLFFVQLYIIILRFITQIQYFFRCCCFVIVENGQIMHVHLRPSFALLTTPTPIPIVESSSKGSSHFYGEKVFQLLRRSNYQHIGLLKH